MPTDYDVAKTFILRMNINTFAELRLELEEEESRILLQKSKEKPGIIRGNKTSTEQNETTVITADQANINPVKNKNAIEKKPMSNPTSCSIK